MLFAANLISCWETLEFQKCIEAIFSTIPQYSSLQNHTLVVLWHLY